MAEERGNLRHDTAHHDLLAEQRASTGERRAAGGLDAGAGRVEQPHHRDPQAQRQLAHPGRLHLADVAHRPGQHREVVGAHGHPATVDGADARHHPVGGEVAPLGLEPGVHRVGEHAVLDEAPRVEQQVEPVPYRQFASGALTGDRLLAAHGGRSCLAGVEVGDERLPVVQFVRRVGGHGSSPLFDGRSEFGSRQTKWSQLGNSNGGCRGQSNDACPSACRRPRPADRADGLLDRARRRGGRRPFAGEPRRGRRPGHRRPAVLHPRPPCAGRRAEQALCGSADGALAQPPVPRRDVPRQLDDEIGGALDHP